MPTKPKKKRGPRDWSHLEEELAKKEQEKEEDVVPVKPKRTRRKAKEVDIPVEEISRVALLSPTMEEMAFVFDVPISYMERQMMREEVIEALEKGRGGRKLSLKRAQWKAAMSGNTAMLIWLGKNDLGQSDKGGEGDDAAELATKITIALKEMHRRTAANEEDRKKPPSGEQVRYAIQQEEEGEED